MSYAAKTVQTTIFHGFRHILAMISHHNMHQIFCYVPLSKHALKCTRYSSSGVRAWAFLCMQYYSLHLKVFLNSLSSKAQHTHWTYVGTPYVSSKTYISYINNAKRVVIN